MRSRIRGGGVPDLAEGGGGDYLFSSPSHTSSPYILQKERKANGRSTILSFLNNDSFEEGGGRKVLPV